MSVDESNKLEIDLAYNTLAWLNSLDDSEIPESVLIRDIVSNLCDFQDRFANPMAFPVFEPDLNKPSKLETPRHLPSLLRFKCAYELPEEYTKKIIDPLDGFIQDDKAYCLAGSELWANLIDTGELKLTEDDLEEPIISRHEWLQDLFLIFNYVKDSEKRSIVRELASCWYFIATHISLDYEDEEDQIALSQLLSNLNIDESTFLKNIQERIENDNLDSVDPQISLEPTKNQSPEDLGTPASIVGALMDAMKGEGNIDLKINGEEDEEEEDEEDEDYVPSTSEEDDDISSEDEDEYSENEDVNEFVDKLRLKIGNVDDGIVEDEEDGEENPIETEFRNLVLETVESLSSYLPTDKKWLERILSSSSLLSEKKMWYPWGFPPMEKINSSLNSKDELESKYSLKLVELLNAK